MANITAQLVKELRDTTQAGMMDCKKALIETDGDMEKAIEFLREKGLAAAAKKANRIAAEGMVDGFVTADQKTGVIVEVNCETDFVAKTDNFKEFCAKIAKHIAIAAPQDVDTLLTQKFTDDPSKTITDLVSDATVAIGEKISIRRFARYEAAAGVVETYIHMGGKIGVLVEVNNDTPPPLPPKPSRHTITISRCRSRPPSRSALCAARCPRIRWTRKRKSSASRRSTKASPRRSSSAWWKAGSRSIIRTSA